MGVPKFYRWLSERYTKINQRIGRISNPQTIEEHYGHISLQSQQSSSLQQSSTTTTSTSTTSNNSNYVVPLSLITTTTSSSDHNDSSHDHTSATTTTTIIQWNDTLPDTTTNSSSSKYNTTHHQNTKGKLAATTNSNNIVIEQVRGIPITNTNSYNKSSNTHNNTTNNTIHPMSLYNIPSPDPLSTSSCLPPIDRLYIDMNGIIHGCSHNNSNHDDDTTTTTDIMMNHDHNHTNTIMDPNNTIVDPNNSTSTTTNTTNTNISEDEIFTNICYYLDRMIKDIVQPTTMIYMAIDGVAPRAKLNQQRSRRYRSGKEGLIEQTIYDAHLKQILLSSSSSTTTDDDIVESLQNNEENNNTTIVDTTTTTNTNILMDQENMIMTTKTTKQQQPSTKNQLFIELSPQEQEKLDRNDDDDDVLCEIEPGRFAGKFTARLLNHHHPIDSTSTNTNMNTNEMDTNIIHHQNMDETSNMDLSSIDTTISPNDDIMTYDHNTTTTTPFHSNNITPGTPFFDRCTKHIQHYIQQKLSNDPFYEQLTIIFSGPNVPGEGEHKILQFIREQQFHYQQEQEQQKKIHNKKKKKKKHKTDATTTTTATNDDDSTSNEMISSTHESSDNNNNNTTTNPYQYHPNLRHCIMGQDGDLIMLGLLTHEPNLCLLREQVSFNIKLKMESDQLSNHPTIATTTTTNTTNASGSNNSSTTASGTPGTTTISPGLQTYIHNPNFELLHMNVLRDYFSYEFETSNVIPTSKWCLEQCIDDFVFMTFFVGNDFLPHLPAVDIADEAFDLLFYTYRDQRKQWLKDKSMKPYLTDQGTIISGKRLENFLQVLGKHETPYLEYKKSNDDTEKARKMEAKFGMNTIPTDEALAAKEASDRAVFRERLFQRFNTTDHDDDTTSTANNIDNVDENGKNISDNENDDDEIMNVNQIDDTFEYYSEYPNFQPVLSSANLQHQSSSKHVKDVKRQPRQSLDNTNDADDDDDDTNIDLSNLDDDEDVDALALSQRMSGLLRFSVGGKDVHVSDEDLKGRYYSDKFGFSPFDAEKHLALRKAYIEGLVWNLKYYYEGCVSWEWYYPYHYGPMLSDLVGIDEMLQEISFEGKIGKPLRPFEQLMACMPPSHADVLPKPYRAFMTDPKSVIADFYPQSFTIDMNGKRWPWEAVVLLPFIESNRLLEAVRTVDEGLLTEDERKRNEFGDVVVFTRDPESSRHVEAVGAGNIFGEIPSCSAKCIPFNESPLYIPPSNEKPVFKPALLEGVEHPLPGFPTLRDGTVTGMWRKLLKVNVHGSKSKYKTALLEIDNPIPEVLSTETIAEHLNGTLLWINHPHFIEAYVTAVSDSKGVIRGKSSRKAWADDDAIRRKKRLQRIVGNYVFGECLVGTGGVTLSGGQDVMSSIDVLLYVRPFMGLKVLDDGTTVKTYAKYEIEVPLFVTGWAPQKEDTRIDNLPVLLEKDPFHAAKYVLNDKRPDENLASVFKSSMDILSDKRLMSMNRLSTARRYHTECEHINQTNGMCWYNGLHSNFNSFGSLPMGVMKQYQQRYQLRTISTFLPCDRWKTSVQPKCYETISLYNQKAMCNKNKPYKSLKSRNIGTRNRYAVTFGIAATVFSLINGYINFAAADSFSNSVHNDGVINRNAWLLPSHEKTYTSSLEKWSSQSSPLPQKRTPPFEFAHGTTTLAFTFTGGIIVAVDSRASLGSFVGSKTTQKLLPIHSHLVGTMAGGAADCMIWIRKLRCEAMHFEIINGRRMSVARASRILANALYENRQFNLSIGSMIMGFDDDANSSTPKIYYVDNSGTRLQGDCFAVGSGSVLALGVLDTERQFEMSRSDAIALGIKAIRHATLRDAYSGGYINVFCITNENGWQRVYAQDIDEIAVLSTPRE